MKNSIVFKVLPSNRKLVAFKIDFPEARFISSAGLRSKSKLYELPLEVYEADREKLKQYGTKSRDQF